MEHHDIPPEWTALFAGKTALEITETRLPPNLSDAEAIRFRECQSDKADEALAGERGQPYVRRLPPQYPLVSEKPARDESPYSNLADELDHGYGFERGGATAAKMQTKGLPPLAIPKGSTDVLLEQQIATCVGIIDHLAHYVARCDTEPHTCNNFMDRIVSMMNSSANVAKMVGRLRGGLQPDEKQLRQIIQHESGESGKPPSPRSVRA